MSPDGEASHRKFKDKQQLPFTLLVDPDHAIAEAYGVWGEKQMYGKTFMGIVRSAFLIDENGALSACWYKISPKDTVPKVMETLKR